MSAQRLARIAVGLGMTALGVAAAGCWDGSDNSTDQSCSSHRDSASFPTGATFTLNKPANCPVVLNDTATLDFSMTITVPSSSVVWNYYNAWVTNRTGGTSTWSTSTTWSGFGTGTYYVQVSGNYYAAHGGWDAQNNGFDVWHHQFSTSGHIPAAHTNLTYTKGTIGASVSGPSTGLGSGVGYDITAEVNDPFMIGPVNWDFYVDDNYVGSNSTGTYHGTAGDPNSTQTILAIITDANSRTASGTYVLTVCDSTQIVC